MTRVRYAERPAAVETRVSGTSQFIFIRTNIVEEEEGFSCDEFIGRTRAGIEADEALIRNIKESDSERAAAAVRAERDKLLKECDFHVLPDVPGDHEAWAAYRQALRDIPEQEGFPYSVAFPEKP